ncbi:MAG: hypothetical protein ER33_09095 [Cyanobium sp. CACIAM 14]|nr:MAG: hypothetical protein ER33_09095 [Cyanobium sp. CACIAM 14]
MGFRSRISQALHRKASPRPAVPSLPATTAQEGPADTQGSDPEADLATDPQKAPEKDPAQDPAQAEWLLVYDGGCPFCRHFALSSETRGGLPGLRIVDGRADGPLRKRLQQRGLPLAEGAVLLHGERAWHGAAAVRRLCGLLRPSDPLLQLLVPLFAAPTRSERLYPLLLAARRAALALSGLPVDPDAGRRQGRAGRGGRPATDGDAAAGCSNGEGSTATRRPCRN